MRSEVGEKTSNEKTMRRCEQRGRTDEDKEQSEVCKRGKEEPKADRGGRDAEKLREVLQEDKDTRRGCYKVKRTRFFLEMNTDKDKERVVGGQKLRKHYSPIKYNMSWRERERISNERD